MLNLLSIFDLRYAALLLATLITIGNFSFYLCAVLARKFKPHLFSWTVWTLLPSIAFAAQWSENAGLGMYQTAIFAFGSGVIMLAAIFYGDKNYTRSDWLCLGFSLCAIPAWALMHNALYAVLIIVTIDVVAMIPTIRKSWAQPYGESPGVFLVGGIVCLLGLAALEVLNTTTVLYPLTVATLNLGFITMLYYRRRRVARA